ncbi:MAG TPA: hypothetical protein VFX85_08525 [Solirubrobacterales bacterium]|nr:hypothetical protein [Solirubrobacterales bacterium]
MGRRTTRVLAVAMAAMLALVVGNALAAKKVTKVHLVAGNIVIDGQGGFAPTALPRTVNAPIEIFGSGKISTVNGELPPILENLQFEFDKHGAVDTTGLLKCSAAKLKATTVPQARKLCPGAIVGTGTGHAIVKFPEQGPIPATSPITIFNGPKIKGDPSVYAHAYLTVPAPTTIVIPVRIETINNGRYGYRVNTVIPKLAGGFGIPISGSIKIGRKWTYKGKKHSYINARCPDGRLQAIGSFGFKDGTQMKGSFLTPCQIRG